MNDPIQTSRAGAAGLPQASTGAVQKSLGQEDFLKLMTAQMTAQDPFKPLESGEFLSQFAQFGTVSGIQALQDSFEGLSSSLKSLQALQASSLVGRSVVLESPHATLPANGTVEGAVDAKGANNVILTVQDPAGQIVQQLSLTAGADGLAPFVWDGHAADGRLVPPGPYTLTAQGTVNGDSVALTTRIEAAVESVTLGQAGLGLTLNIAGIGPMDAGAILEIK